jgi:uncharacterized protein involved in exopolysaccharide biosynthesis
MTSRRDRTRDTIDLRELIGALRRGILWLPAGVALGVLGAVIVNQFPHRYEGEATVVLRDRSDAGIAGFSMDLFEGLPSGIGDALSLPGGFAGAVETEAAILGGRSLLRDVVEEMGLQVRVVRPRATPAERVFRRVQMEEGAPRGRFTFRRSGSGWEVRGAGGFRARVEDGGSASIPGGVVELVSGITDPDRFTIQVRSRWETVDRIRRRDEVAIGKAGGDLAEVTVRWTDPWTAAEVANLLVERYLDERRTRIRRLAQERFDLLGGVRDSLAAEVDSAGEALRRFHEAAGTFEPERLGDLERIGELRARVDEIEVEARALDEVLRRLTEADEIRTSDLLAFPSFLESPAINQVLQRLSDLRSQREILLERRTPRDPDVQVLDRNIRNLEAELLDLGLSYRDGLHRSLDEIQARLGRYRADLQARPRVETEAVLLENQLELTGATYVGVQAQVVRSRLEAVGEGAELRQVDRAELPTRPRFPRRNLNLALGFLAGLLVGSVGAVAGGAVTNRISDPSQLRGRLGLPVLTQGSDLPLPIALRNGHITLVPVGDREMGQEGADLLAREWAVSEESIRIVRSSEIEGGEGVLLVVREGGRALGRCEELVAALDSAGAPPQAVVLLPPRPRG